MSDKRKEVLSSIFFAVLSIVYSCGTFSIRGYNAFGVTVLTSASVPRALAVILFLLSCLHCYASLRVRKEDEVASSSNDEVHGVNIKKELEQAEKNESDTGNVCTTDVVLTVVFLILYIVGLANLGFIISTIFYIFMQSELMTKKTDRKRSIPWCVVLSIIVTITIYYLFNNLLALMLPVGPFGI